MALTWIAANFTLIQAHLASSLYSFEVHTYLKREPSFRAWPGRKDDPRPMHVETDIMFTHPTNVLVSMKTLL